MYTNITQACWDVTSYVATWYLSEVISVVGFIGSLSFGGYKMMDIPVVGSFIKTLEYILTMYDRFENEISKLKEENEQLHSSIDDLKKVSNSLKKELDNFAKLQENLEEFAKQEKNDFNKIMNQLNGNFDRINNLVHEQNRVLLMQLAQNIEFLDSKEGMSKIEFLRFVDRIPHQFQTHLTQMNEYQNIDKQFKNNQNCTVNAKTIQLLIDQLCQSI